MEYKTDQFYIRENGIQRLKKDYILSFHKSPGLYDKLCTVELFVKEDMNYELFLFFHEKNIPEFIKTNKVERISVYQKSKLPPETRKLLLQIMNSDFKLEESYYNSKNTTGMLDLTRVTCYINHKKINFSIDLSPETLNKNAFKTQSETDFLKLTALLENWLNKLTDNQMAFYQID